MLTANDIMNPNPEHCFLDTPINNIIKHFAEKETDYILVVDEDERLCGIITESDLVDQQANLHVPTAMTIFDMVLPLGEGKFETEVNRLQALTAQELMVGDLKTVTPKTSINDLATLMSESNIHHLPVIDGKTVEGILTKHDLIRALASHL
ncbi:MAG: CBS domain-containing protein [Ghiorsea sp.]